MEFFVGLHQPSDAHRFQRVCISINRIRARKSPFQVREWLLDSGAFSLITKHGDYPQAPEEYAAQVIRWSAVGTLRAAVSQDYMCEPWIVARTGLSVAEHQRRTIDRYDRIRAAVPIATYVMPVLQGYAPTEYVSHLADYGRRLGRGAWVGVGSVCKRNGSPADVYRILHAIRSARPDLRLHGFGVKLTTLQSSARHLLATADSMAWSYSARKRGADANAWMEAARFVAEVESVTMRIDPQGDLFGPSFYARGESEV